VISELTSLLDAELSYACFNAQRTSGGAPADAISISNTGNVYFITDSSRPQSPYYNRAVVHPEAASLVETLREVPSNVRAVELLFPQQTKQNFGCLLDAGFKPANSLCYLTAIPTKIAVGDMSVKELRTDQRDYFFDLLELSGASFPQEKRDATRDFYCTESFRCFVAYDASDQPAGWATMYVNNGTAFLANAFTLVDHRRKGTHSALLSTRLNIASQLQLPHAFTVLGGFKMFVFPR